MRSECSKKLISLDFMISVNVNCPVSQTCHIGNSYKLWHDRFGHISKNSFIELKNKQMVDDMNQIESEIPNDESM